VVKKLRLKIDYVQENCTAKLFSVHLARHRA